MEAFRTFLMSAPQGGGKSGTLSQNTASTYFSIFKVSLKQAFIDGYLTIDISAKVKGIQEQESRREFLTVEELNSLAQAPCDPLLKRAALFSALTGIRHCDIQKLKWSEVEEFNGGYRLNFTQQKTKGVEYMSISEQAFELCGERQDGDLLVFAGLTDPSWINRPVKKWGEAAGIKKHITFHLGRHRQQDAWTYKCKNYTVLRQCVQNGRLINTSLARSLDWVQYNPIVNQFIQRGNPMGSVAY